MGTEGIGLYHLLVELTGLERKEIEPVLDRLLAKLKLNRDSLTTEDVRKVMALYLDEVNQEMEPSDPTGATAVAATKAAEA